MIRPSLVLLTTIAAFSAHGQGIRGVTRRTPTQEFQAPARQFFDAAGININGTAAGSPTASGPSMPGPTSAGVTRPANPGPMLSNKSGQAPVQARPYVLGNSPAPSVATNHSTLTARPLTPAKSTTPLRPALRSSVVTTPTTPTSPQASPRPPLPPKP